MITEEKQLLFKALCEQLPYNLRLESKQLYGGTLSNIEKTGDSNARITITCCGALRVNKIIFPLSSINKHLPYLRPMSSMTEDEKEKLKEEYKKDEKVYAEVLERIASGDKSARGTAIPHFAADWCNKKHFDYRGLIPMGLALEAPKDMYEIQD